MRIPDDVQKCVCFLGIKPSPDKPPKYQGTGFFLGVERPKLNGAFLYLVTAKHVADKLIGNDHYYIRINTKQGQAVDLEVPGRARWFLHPDNSVDVVLLPIGPSPDLDFLALNPNMFVTEQLRQERSIGPGDEVFITGLFYYHTGNSKNIAIIRTGHIAMVPGERIQTSKYGAMEAYLIESRSIGGISGSPVFVFSRTRERIDFFLLGLIHGHWESESVVDIVELDSAEKRGVNTGIAIVTPATKILEILQSPELKQLVEQQETDILAGIEASKAKIR